MAVVLSTVSKPTDFERWGSGLGLGFGLGLAMTMEVRVMVTVRECVPICTSRECTYFLL